MTDHTPTPWICDSEGILPISRDGVSVIARIPNHPENQKNWDADAAFIVNAVNNHEPLVEMVRELVTILDGAQSGFISGCGSDLAWHKGRESRIADARLLLDRVGGARE